MDKQIMIEIIDEQIAFESIKDLNELWTEEYREGFVDGLERAKEVLMEGYLYELS